MERFYLSLSKYFISLTTIAIFIVALSFLMEDLLPQDFLPEIEIPKISILINCPNCSNQKIEEEIVTPLRAQLILLDGLKDFSAESIAGKGIIELEFFIGQSVEKKVYAINEIIDRTQENFPIAAQRPIVYPFNLNDIPVVLLSVQRKNGQEYPELEEIKRALESLNTVSFTENIGQTLKQTIVQPNYERLDQLGISSNHLFQTIQKSVSGNPLEFRFQEGWQTVDVTVMDTLSKLKDIPIDWKNQSIPLHLLAKIKEEIYFDGGQFLLNGQPAVLFSIYKQPHQSYQNFHTEIHQRIADLKFNLPEYNFQIIRNHANIVQQSITALQSSFLSGILLIIGLIFLFYKKVNITLLAGSSLLLTVSCIVVIFFFLNISINLISITALMITVGIVIDNTIIVVDGLKGIQRKNNFRAIGQSVRQILPALLTGNLTTLIIFVPLIFLPNLSGQLLKYFGLILGIGLATGLIISLVFIPVFFNWYFKPIPESKLARNWTNRYLYWHNKWMKNNIFSILTSLVIIGCGIFCWNKLPKDLIPALEFGELSFFIPFSTFSKRSLSLSNLKMLENWIAKSKCRTWFVKYTDGGTFDQWIQNQKAGWILSLSNCISTSDNQIILDFQPSIESEKIYDHPIHSLFNYNDQFFQLRIKPEEISKISSDFHIPPTPHTLDTQFLELPFQLLKTRTKSKKVEEIIASFDNRIIFPGNLFWEKEKHLVFEKRNQDYSKILVENENHHFIPFPYLIRKVVTNRPNRIYSNAYGVVAHLNFPNQAYPSLIRLLKKEGLSNYQIRGLPNLKNEQQLDFLKIGGATIFALLFMLFLHFQSWKLSFLILMEIPMSVMGSLILLHLFDAGVNIMSLAGIIISLGIVVNDSILKMDLIQQLLETENYGLETAVLQASKKRFLPIILTSLSTVLAVIPIFWSPSFGNQLQVPFALSLIGGMSVSTFTSLFLLPKWILWLKFY